jgi:hypothetical protein
MLLILGFSLAGKQPIVIIRAAKSPPCLQRALNFEMLPVCPD